MSTEMELMRVHAGATLILGFQIVRSNGNPEQITGWTGDKIKFLIAKTRGGPAVVTINLDNGVEIVSATTGHGLVRLKTGLFPDELKAGGYHVELEADGIDGPSVQAHGPLRIDPSI